MLIVLIAYCESRFGVDRLPRGCDFLEAHLEVCREKESCTLVATLVELWAEHRNSKAGPRSGVASQWA